MFIPDTWTRIRTFSIPGPESRIQIFSIVDPRSRICNKEFSYFNPKKWYLSSQKYDPGFSSRIRILDPDPDFLPIPDADLGSQILDRGVKRHRIPDPGSWIQIRKTGDFGFALAVGCSIGFWHSRGAAVSTTHLMDQLSVAFICKKEFSVYFISTQSL